MPTDASQNHLEWALQWGAAPWLIVGLIAVLVLLLSAWNLRQLASRPRQAVLLLFRALTVAALLVVLGQPTWVSTAHRPGSRELAVLIDRSQSMAVGPAGNQRWDQAVAAVKRLAAVQPVRLYTVGQGLAPVDSPDALTALQPVHGQTDLLGALQQLAQGQRAGALGGVVVVSDGLDNGELALRNAGLAQALDSDSAEVVDQLAAPIHGLLTEDRRPVRDVAVAAVRSSAFGFARTFLPVTVELELSGYQGADGELTLTLQDNGEVVATQQVPLAGPVQRTIALEIQPLQVGHHILQAEVVPLADESTTTNNRGWASLRAVRERTRVLHLAGHPSWDTRFLRLWLRGNAAVDLISFYVMVGQNSGMYVSAEDTTLIPFPTDEIFEQSLTSFDLLVFQDFPFGPFQVERYLPQLQQYLTGGGALLVLGGPMSLSAGGYYGTQVADWLPLRLEPLTGADPGYAEGPLTPKLTPAGRIHPVSQLHADPEQSASRWAAHGLVGYNTALRATDGGSVLVTNDRDQPVLAVGDVGKGRSAVLATDSLWTWAFAGDDDKDDNREHRRADYVRLLDQLTGWLLRDPDLDLLQLELAGGEANQPGQVAIAVTLRTAGGAALAGSALQVGHLPLTPLPGEPALTPWPTPTDADGKAIVRLTDLAPGAHAVTVTAEVQGRVQRAMLPVVVAATTKEQSRLQPSDHLLQLLARASDGKVWKSQDAPAPLPLASRDLADVADKVHTPLWNRPEVLLLIVALMSLEWGFRRRWGLA
jgi:hypothetical protein